MRKLLVIHSIFFALLPSMHNTMEIDFLLPSSPQQESSDHGVAAPIDLFQLERQYGLDEFTQNTTYNPEYLQQGITQSLSPLNIKKFITPPQSNASIMQSKPFIKTQSAKKRRRYPCSQCAYSSSQSCNRMRHMITKHIIKTHPNLKPFSCRLCPKISLRKDILKLHLKNAHGISIKEQIHQNMHCNKSDYKSLKNLVAASLKSSKKLKNTCDSFLHTCPQCGKDYDSMCIFKKHITNHIFQHKLRNIEPYSCSGCFAKFKHQPSLNFMINKHDHGQLIVDQKKDALLRTAIQLFIERSVHSK